MALLMSDVSGILCFQCKKISKVEFHGKKSLDSIFSIPGESSSLRYFDSWYSNIKELIKKGEGGKVVE